MYLLVIQTAFIGDAILATPVIEKLYRFYPQARIDILVRKGNEHLFEAHPFLNEILIWDKKQNKLQNMFRLIVNVREKKYTHVINLHRFASSGVISAFSGAPYKSGFDKNPLSFFYTKKIRHEIGNGKHEIERNLELIADITDTSLEKPRLYPAQGDYSAVKRFKHKSYVCIAPTSVWFTKQWPAEKWISLIQRLGSSQIYLLGAPGDRPACEKIMKESNHPAITNLAGELSLLESAALMKDARMNYVNDSAPMHIASAMDAPVTAIFCSTVPGFGFGPLSSRSRIIEINSSLECRPCGLHGYPSCPKGHFKCALEINASDFAINH